MCKSLSIFIIIQTRLWVHSLLFTKLILGFHMSSVHFVHLFFGGQAIGVGMAQKRKGADVSRLPSAWAWTSRNADKWNINSALGVYNYCHEAALYTPKRSVFPLYPCISDVRKCPSYAQKE